MNVTILEYIKSFQYIGYRFHFLCKKLEIYDILYCDLKNSNNFNMKLVVCIMYNVSVNSSLNKMIVNERYLPLSTLNLAIP